MLLFFYQLKLKCKFGIHSQYYFNLINFNFFLLFLIPLYILLFLLISEIVKSFF